MTNCEYCGAPSKAIDEERERIRKILLGSPPKLRMDFELHIDGIFVQQLETFHDVERWTRLRVQMPMGKWKNLLPIPENHTVKIVVNLIPEQEKGPQ